LSTPSTTGRHPICAAIGGKRRNGRIAARAVLELLEGSDEGLGPLGSLFTISGLLLSSYLWCLRSGVGWHVTWCARNKRGLVQRLAGGGTIVATDSFFFSPLSDCVAPLVLHSRLMVLLFVSLSDYVTSTILHVA
jgi:hypothetical protein